MASVSSHVYLLRQSRVPISIWYSSGRRALHRGKRVNSRQCKLTHRVFLRLSVTQPHVLSPVLVSLSALTGLCFVGWGHHMLAFLLFLCMDVSASLEVLIPPPARIDTLPGVVLAEIQTLCNRSQNPLN